MLYTITDLQTYESVLIVNRAISRPAIASLFPNADCETESKIDDLAMALAAQRAPYDALAARLGLSIS